MLVQAAVKSHHYGSILAQKILKSVQPKNMYGGGGYVTYAYTRVLGHSRELRAWLYTMLKIGNMTKSGMENKKKSTKTVSRQKIQSSNFKFPPKS